MRRSTYALLALSLVLVNPGLAHGAPKPASPKVGDCYLYTPDEVELFSTKKPPVNCKNLHNVETYRVIASQFKKDPNLEPPINIFTRVSPICEAGISKSNFFTGWGIKIPTKSEWKSGARWLRCDGLVIMRESETATYKSWKGKKLDFK
jgi:hypothetical protein